jgi:hypothetical protein
MQRRCQPVVDHLAGSELGERRMERAAPPHERAQLWRLPRQRGHRRKPM